MRAQTCEIIKYRVKNAAKDELLLCSRVLWLVWQTETHV